MNSTAYSSSFRVVCIGQHENHESVMKSTAYSSSFRVALASMKTTSLRLVNVQMQLNLCQNYVRRKLPKSLNGCTDDQGDTRTLDLTNTELNHNFPQENKKFLNNKNVIIWLQNVWTVFRILPAKNVSKLKYTMCEVLQQKESSNEIKLSRLVRKCKLWGINSKELTKKISLIFLTEIQCVGIVGIKHNLIAKLFSEVPFN